MFFAAFVIHPSVVRGQSRFLFDPLCPLLLEPPSHRERREDKIESKGQVFRHPCLFRSDACAVLSVLSDSVVSPCELGRSSTFEIARLAFEIASFRGRNERIAIVMHLDFPLFDGQIDARLFAPRAAVVISKWPSRVGSFEMRMAAKRRVAAEFGRIFSGFASIFSEQRKKVLLRCLAQRLRRNDLSILCRNAVEEIDDASDERMIGDEAVEDVAVEDEKLLRRPIRENSGRALPPRSDWAHRRGVFRASRGCRCRPDDFHVIGKRRG